MPLRKNVLMRVSGLIAGILLIAHISTMLWVQSETTKTVFTDLFTPAVNLLAAGVAGWAALTMRRSRRLMAGRIAMAWGLFALAQFFTAVGDSLWAYFELGLGIDPYPSAADFFYLLFYPVFLAGMVLLPARRQSRLEWLKTSLDMLIILSAVILFHWNFVIGPNLSAGAESWLAAWLGIAYPFGDFFLIAALLMIIYRSSRTVARRPILLLLAGTAVLIIYDYIFSYQSLREIYQSGTVIDSVYILASLLFIMAGVSLATSQDRQIEADVSERDSALFLNTLWVRYLPYLWVAGSFILLMVRNFVVYTMTVWEMTLNFGVIIALVLLRQVVSLRENSMLYRDLQLAHDQAQKQAAALDEANQAMQKEIDERRRVQDRLSYDALHDALTGLPNRALFLDRLNQAGLKKKRNPNYHYAVLFIDLDSFKVVNDSLGHLTGDQLLTQIAHILQYCLRSTDTVARLGGDEFVILLDDVSRPEDVVITADRLQTALSHPIQLKSTRLFVSASIGIVEYVDANNSPEDILRDADLAMYQAKSRGKACYVIFRPSMRENAITRLSLETGLRRALENDEFVLYYQPILALPDQRLAGFEALVRWEHPIRGMVPPSEFIPLAEETGLILPLGRTILEKACRQCVAWLAEFPDLPALKMNVNISGKQLKQPDFVRLVDQVLKETGLPATCLALEVTETVCLDSLETVSETLIALQALGVETQIDDFGTGYSSLSYLQRLPVRAIKIDRSFIQAINNREGTAPDIVQAIFSMVDHLGIRAVAEGIENEMQLNVLQQMNCAYAQGYLLAVPMASDEAQHWAHHHQPVEAVSQPRS